VAQQADQVELTAEKRTVLGKQVKQLRRQGWVPGVMYGHGFDPVPLQFEERSLRQLLSHVGGSQLVGVNVKGKKGAEVPLVLTGESPVVESREGILLQGISAIEVECLPGDLVDAIEVDLSDLAEVFQALHVSDLAVPAGIEILTDPDEMIARLVPLEEEEIFEEVVEEELVPEAEEVEVITEAREAEEGEPTGEGEEE
jgi:large subunit ribosomal protein L25